MGRKFELRRLVDRADKELLSEIKRVACFLNKNSITTYDMDKHGKIHSCTIRRRFGSWNIALKKAGLKQSKLQSISEEELFKNLKVIWEKYRRQPYYQEIKKPLSKYSIGTYENRWGTWTKACLAFIEYMEKTGQKQIEPKYRYNKEAKEKNIRSITPRIRLKIFRKDHFRCVKCGRSPATHLGTILHIDHIVPISKGGKTEMSNLQTLCQDCNLGKGNEKL